MADLISRAAALDVLVTSPNFHTTLTRIEELPAVAAAPVVRCKDCKHRPVDHRDEYNDVTGFSIEFPDVRCPCQCEDGWYNWYPDDDWYCANGERKEDEHENSNHTA